MAAENLTEIFSKAGGVSNAYIMKHDDLPTGKKLEECKFPKLSDGSSGDWDIIGKFETDSFSPKGEDITVETKLFTDGTVAAILSKEGTYGFDAKLQNISTAVCKKFLNMEEVAAVSGDTGVIGERKVLGYGKEKATIPNAAFYIEFNDSNEWAGILFPNIYLASKFITGGGVLDLSTVQMSALASAAAPKTFVEGVSTDFTNKYVGFYYMLIPKA